MQVRHRVEDGPESLCQLAVGPDSQLATNPVHRWRRSSLTFGLTLYDCAQVPVRNPDIRGLVDLDPQRSHVFGILVPPLHQLPGRPCHLPTPLQLRQESGIVELTDVAPAEQRLGLVDAAAETGKRAAAVIERGNQIGGPVDPGHIDCGERVDQDAQFRLDEQLLRLDVQQQDLIGADRRAQDSGRAIHDQVCQLVIRRQEEAVPLDAVLRDDRSNRGTRRLEQRRQYLSADLPGFGRLDRKLGIHGHQDRPIRCVERNHEIGILERAAGSKCRETRDRIDIDDRLDGSMHIRANRKRGANLLR